MCVHCTLIVPVYMYYINHSEGVYMANILPETEVEGSIVRHIHRLTMIHIIYLIHCDVINFVSATCTRVYGTLTGL